MQSVKSLPRDQSKENSSKESKTNDGKMKSAITRCSVLHWDGTVFIRGSPAVLSKT